MSDPTTITLPLALIKQIKRDLNWIARYCVHGKEDLDELCECSTRMSIKADTALKELNRAIQCADRAKEGIENLAVNQQPVPPEFEKTFRDNFNEIVCKSDKAEGSGE